MSERKSFLSQAYKARVFRLTNTQLRYWILYICFEGEYCRISEQVSEPRDSWVCVRLLVTFNFSLTHSLVLISNSIKNLQDLFKTMCSYTFCCCTDHDCMRKNQLMCDDTFNFNFLLSSGSWDNSLPKSGLYRIQHICSCFRVGKELNTSCDFNYRRQKLS